MTMTGAEAENSSGKANFFLVGAPKAGTTSVDRMLRRHPAVFLSPIKEPCHFCPDVADQIVHRRGKIGQMDMSSYLAVSPRRTVHLSWVSSPRDYARLFEGAVGYKVVGECSTFYLSSKVAPKIIHSYNPEARIVVLVRNPINRIRSHYAMDRSLGLTDRSLVTLVEEELALGDHASWGNCQFYLGASQYCRQIEQFRRYFTPDQICVLSFEELLSSPETELRSLFEFLDISIPPGPLQLPLENKSRAARFPRLHDALRDSALKPLIAYLLNPHSSRLMGKAIRSVYYRGNAPLVSDDELVKVESMLKDAGLDAVTDAHVLRATVRRL